MKSGYNIEWTSEAERNLSTIFDYLEENWAQREISNFAIQLETNLEYISEHPAAFPFYSEEKNVRRCVLSPQNMTRQITFIIYFIGTLIITSCSDGKYRSPRIDVHPRTLDTVTVYFPHEYKESIIDLVLDVDINFKVIIKKSTLMDKFVIQTFKQDGNV
jgi:plasmid stabilization system protein ParE